MEMGPVRKNEIEWKKIFKAMANPLRTLQQIFLTKSLTISFSKYNLVSL